MLPAFLPVLPATPPSEPYRPHTVAQTAGPLYSPLTARLHNHHKKQWTQHRSLMHPHSYLKAFCPLPLDFHSRCRPRVHCLYQPYHTPLHSQPSQCPPQNLSRHSIERFLQIHKSHPQFSSLLQILLLHLPYYKHCISSPSSWHKSKMHVINANPPLHYIPPQSRFHYPFKHF